ncbi:MAG: radical SAM protein [Candidatus Helarchaeota archaeon]
MSKREPKYIRLSIGTATVLGLNTMQLDAVPTTAYLMLYSEKKCLGNCGFCPQARESEARSDVLSRIYWPKYSLDDVENAFRAMTQKMRFKRICIQVINYNGFFEDLVSIIKRLRAFTIPISVSVQPLNANQMRELYQLGVNRIGIPVDAATAQLFYQVKGKGAKGIYDWEKHMDSLRTAQKIFGEKNVSTHLIIGLGESDYEALKFIQDAVDAQILPALFTFTPIRGTQLERVERPTLFRYRKIQLARYLILEGICRIENFIFDETGRLIQWGIPKEQLMEIIQTGTPFLTSGCPGCNRPFYNERPSEVLYNYPRTLTNDEIQQIIELFKETQE